MQLLRIGSICLLAVSIAGCLESTSDSKSLLPLPVDPAPIIDKFPIELNHDHLNPALHKAQLNLESVAWVRTGVGMIPNAPVFNLGVAKDLLVASLGTFAPAGGALAPPMGLLVVDVKDPTKPVALSVTEFPGGGVESVAITDDARFAFLGTEFSGSVGIWTVDLQNPRSPRVVGFTPQATEGPHNIRFGTIGNRQFVFASVAHVATGLSAAGLGQDPLPLIDLRVDIFEFTPAQPNMPMRLVSSYRAQDTLGTRGGIDIVHDAVLQVHPITGAPILYVAHWDRGVRLVDLSRPEAPREIGRYVDPAPTDFLIIHTVKPHPTLIEGRHYTVATSQCSYAPQSVCYVRILDATDPAQPIQVGTWTLPDEVHGGGYTTEIFDLADGKVYVPWSHAGVWVLDINSTAKAAAPVALGYYFVSSSTTTGTGARVPNSNAIVLKDGLAVLADIATGLHTLRFTGDSAAPPTPGAA